jgi:hypothetical protein
MLDTELRSQDSGAFPENPVQDHGSAAERISATGDQAVGHGSSGKHHEARSAAAWAHGPQPVGVADPVKQRPLPEQSAVGAHGGRAGS